MWSEWTQHSTEDELAHIQVASWEKQYYQPAHFVSHNIRKKKWNSLAKPHDAGKDPAVPAGCSCMWRSPSKAVRTTRHSWVRGCRGLGGGCKLGPASALSYAFVRQKHLPVAGAGSRHDAAEERCFHWGVPVELSGQVEVSVTTLLWKAHQIHLLWLALLKMWWRNWKIPGLELKIIGLLWC